MGDGVEVTRLSLEQKIHGSNPCPPALESGRQIGKTRIIN